MSTSGALNLPRPKVAGTWEMYRAMVGVGLICGLLIVSVFLLTKPVIERNRAEALQRAIFQVLPEASSSKTFQLTDAGGFVAVDDGGQADSRVYAGYDAAQQLVGFAVEASGMGYADVIRVLYGYSIGDDAVVGIRVLESKETPGLGDRIESDPAFLANFEKLDVRLNADRSDVANPVRFVKPGTKQQPWEVDGITGATISSRAIAGMLGRSTAYWIPRIQNNVNDFKTEE